MRKWKKGAHFILFFIHTSKVKMFHINLSSFRIFSLNVYSVLVIFQHICMYLRYHNWYREIQKMIFIRNFVKYIQQFKCHSPVLNSTCNLIFLGSIWPCNSQKWKITEIWIELVGSTQKKKTLYVVTQDANG